MIFPSAGQDSGESRVSTLGFCRGPLDQFLRGPLAAEELNSLSDPESIAGKLACAPEQSDQLA